MYLHLLYSTGYYGFGEAYNYGEMLPEFLDYDFFFFRKIQTSPKDWRNIKFIKEKNKLVKNEKTKNIPKQTKNTPIADRTEQNGLRTDQEPTNQNNNRPNRPRTNWLEQ